MRSSHPLGPASYRFGALLFACAAFAAPAVARAQQVTVFSDDFEATSGLDTSKWVNVHSNYDGPSSGTGWRDGTYDGRPDDFGSYFPSYSLYFRGIGFRDAQTQTLDLSARGAVLIFDLASNSSDSQAGLPFEEIEGNFDNIFLEYSTTPDDLINGWTEFEVIQHDDTRFNVTSNVAWTSLTVQLPSAAWTTTTAIRFRQQGLTIVRGDNWAIDNVVVLVNPEPGTWVLFGSGVVGLGAVAARRRRRRPRVSAAAPPAS